MTESKTICAVDVDIFGTRLRTNAAYLQDGSYDDLTVEIIYNKFVINQAIARRQDNDR